MGNAAYVFDRIRRCSYGYDCWEAMGKSIFVRRQCFKISDGSIRGSLPYTIDRGGCCLQHPLFPYSKEKGRTLSLKPSTTNHPLEFRNTTERGLNLDTVHERILQFMRLDPVATYKFIIGTDCQVHTGHTKFITGVVIQRLGKGAWACYRQVIVPTGPTFN